MPCELTANQGKRKGAPEMETLGGFPNLPALWLRRAKPDSANATMMETLGGFPNLPALWLRRAKPDSANATMMETLGAAVPEALATGLPTARCARPGPNAP
jgi:hypothetical protein